MTRPLRILIVEDNAADVHTLRRHLQADHQLDIEIEDVGSHEEAMETLARTAFDLLLLDYNLPGKSGLDTLRQLSERDAELPVIVLTGQGNEQVAVQAFRLGADEYLPKSDLTAPRLKQTILDVLNRFHQEQAQQRRIERLKTKAQRDDLTLLLNRRAFRSRLREEIKRAERYTNDLCLLMVDVDEFKSINDRFGHVVGNRVLKRIAAALRSTLRESDIAARYGGDEFCILVPQTDLQGAKKLARRLQKNLSFEIGETLKQNFSVSCSIGLAPFQPGESDIDDLIAQADRAMYRAKQQGKGQVCYALST